MLVLLDATSPELTPYASVVSGIAALLAVVFAFLAFGAARRRGNPGLRWVAGAFLLFAAKNVFATFNVVTHRVPHDAIELVLAATDLLIMAMLFAPLILRRRS